MDQIVFQNKSVFRNSFLYTGKNKKAYWEWEPGNNRITWSEEMYAIFGIYRGEVNLTCRKIRKRMLPSSIDALNDILGKVISTKQPLYFEKYLEFFQTESKLLFGIARPETDKAGNLLRISGYLLDVTEIDREDSFQEAIKEMKAIQEELQNKNAELEQRLHERTEDLSRANFELNAKNEELIRLGNDLDNFMYVASHDLKTPVSNLEGLLMNLSRELKDIEKEDLRTLMEMTTISVEKLKKMVHDLTDLSRLQKETPEDVKMVGLREALKEVLSGLKREIEEADVEVLINFHECSELKFSVKHLRSILYNLISNAIKFRAPGRKAKVLINASPMNEYIALSVIDNGLGISELQLSRIFTMFKRFHDHVEGSGIGLYMVKKIIENAGGKIEVDSEQDKGSVFKVYFKR